VSDDPTPENVHARHAAINALEGLSPAWRDEDAGSRGERLSFPKRPPAHRGGSPPTVLDPHVARGLGILAFFERGKAGFTLVARVYSNKELVRRYYERVVDEHRPEELPLFIHPKYVDHNSDGNERGPALVFAHLEGLRRTFPDFHLRVEQMVAEGDLVATRVTASGTHTGVWQEIAPTGSEIRLDGINIDRVEAGLIAEHWGQADTVGMLHQMGVDAFAGRSR
jgi:predicted ester cyclase